MNNADDFDSHITDLLSTPDGQMQALESANELATLQLKEAREQRTLLVTSSQANIQDRMKTEKQDELRSTWWQEMTKTDKLQGISGKSPKAVKGQVIVPSFSEQERARGMTDFNELHVIHGLDQVKHLVERSVERLSLVRGDELEMTNVLNRK